MFFFSISFFKSAIKKFSRRHVSSYSWIFLIYLYDFWQTVTCEYFLGTTTVFSGKDKNGVWVKVTVTLSLLVAMSKWRRRRMPQHQGRRGDEEEEEGLSYCSYTSSSSSKNSLAKSPPPPSSSLPEWFQCTFETKKTATQQIFAAAART